MSLNTVIVAINAQLLRWVNLTRYESSASCQVGILMMGTLGITLSILLIRAAQCHLFSQVGKEDVGVSEPCADADRDIVRGRSPDLLFATPGAP